jgi:adhesin HecA-like repeat protein
MEYAKQSNVVVLATGDGDFDLLVDRIRKDFGGWVEVYGVAAQLTATSLINSASKFIAIEDDLLLKITR